MGEGAERGAWMWCKCQRQGQQDLRLNSISGEGRGQGDSCVLNVSRMLSVMTISKAPPSPCPALDFLHLIFPMNTTLSSWISAFPSLSTQMSPNHRIHYSTTPYPSLSILTLPYGLQPDKGCL